MAVHEIQGSPKIIEHYLTYGDVGRSKLYASIYTPLERIRWPYRANGVGIDPKTAEMLPAPEFWVVVGRKAEELKCSIAQALMHLIDSDITPGQNPPHPLMRCVQPSVVQE